MATDSCHTKYDPILSASTTRSLKWIFLAFVSIQFHTKSITVTTRTGMEFGMRGSEENGMLEGKWKDGL